MEDVGLITYFLLIIILLNAALQDLVIPKFGSFDLLYIKPFLSLENNVWFSSPLRRSHLHLSLILGRPKVFCSASGRLGGDWPRRRSHQLIWRAATGRLLGGGTVFYLLPVGAGVRLNKCNRFNVVKRAWWCRASARLCDGGETSSPGR